MSELIERSRTWVRDNYGKSAEHLLKAEQWLRRINPEASEALLLATLTHDMERAFPGPDSPRLDPARGPDDPIYNQAHSERSARIVSDFLREQQAPEALIADVAGLIRAHEIGGSPHAESAEAAANPRFPAIKIGFFLRRICGPPSELPRTHVPAQIAFMCSRLHTTA